MGAGTLGELGQAPATVRPSPRKCLLDLPTGVMGPDTGSGTPEDKEGVGSLLAPRVIMGSRVCASRRAVPLPTSALSMSELDPEEPTGV